MGSAGGEEDEEEEIERGERGRKRRRDGLGIHVVWGEERCVMPNRHCQITTGTTNQQMSKMCGFTGIREFRPS